LSATSPVVVILRRSTEGRASKDAARGGRVLLRGRATRRRLRMTARAEIVWKLDRTNWWTSATNNHWPFRPVGGTMRRPDGASRRIAFVTTSADVAHVRDVAATGTPLVATRRRPPARQTAWLAAILVVILAALVVP